MNQAQRNALLDVFHQMEAFCGRLGAQEESAIFGKLYAELQQGVVKKETLEREAWKAKGLVAFKVARFAASSPNRAAIAQEFSRLKSALTESMFPAASGTPAETTVKGLAGNDETTRVIGDPSAAPGIAKLAIRAVEKFSSLICKQNIEAALSLYSTEYRARTTVKQFQSALARADRQFGGPVLDSRVERLTFICADEVSRQTANTLGQWPKDTPKSTKRAIVGAFWFTRPLERRGRWVQLWVTEESNGYRIAKLHQYLQ